MLIIFGPSYSEETNKQVLAFDNIVKHNWIDGCIETVPAIRSLMISLDINIIDPSNAEDWCRNLLEKTDWHQCNLINKPRRLKIPVIYGGNEGPEIEEIAEYSGVSIKEIIKLHTNTILRVICLGFAPGLSYLAQLPPEFNVTRNITSGIPVPAGSILIANRQTVFTATAIPTGWKRIGISPVIGFDPEQNHPFLLGPGDQVQFFQILPEDTEKWRTLDWSTLVIESS